MRACPVKNTPGPDGQFPAEASGAFDRGPVDLSKYRSESRLDVRTRIRGNLWRWIGMPLFRHSPCGVTGGRAFDSFRAALLRAFGAVVGQGTTILPCEIHYPWNLAIGDYSWIGEDVLLYALAPILIGDNVCVSQRTFLCTGSHDISDPTFGLVVGEIRLKNGCWACAGAFIGPGVTLHEGAVAAAGSVVVRDLPAMTVWGGNPCAFIKRREMRKATPSLEH